MTDVRVPRPRARRGEGERLRDEILAAASALLMQTGDRQAVSIRAVADRVGVTPPSIYLHFADKADLMHAVCQHHFHALDDCIEEAVAGTDDPLEQLRLRGRAYMRFGLEHPEQYRILFMSRPAKIDEPPDESLLRASGFTALVANVLHAIDAGVFAPADPLMVSTGLWTVVHGVTSLAISVPHFALVDLDALLDHLMDAHVAGLRP